MRIGIFSDPHLGLRRRANTTKGSSQRLQDALYFAAIKASTFYTEVDAIVCGGDLFDRYSNPENIILQGCSMPLSMVVIGGNHDESNRAGAKSSLEVVASNRCVIRADVGSVHYAQRDFGVIVPHHTTQELFERALQEALDDPASKGKPLFVHCNRGSFPGEQADSTLYIPSDMEEVLLEVFTRVFYGHIHTPTFDLNSRGFQLGNTHPTGFGDISDKFSYVYDTETDELTATKIWSKDEGYMELKVGDPLPDREAQFISVSGVAKRKDASDYVRDVWDKYPEAFAVRFSGTCIDDILIDDVDEAVTVDSLETIIARELEATDLLELYTELRSTTGE